VLRVRLCGPLATELDGAPLVLPSSERARALICWLALHPGSHSRLVVAAALWPDVPAESARANLRTAIWAIRTAWGHAATAIVASRSSLGLVDVSVDVGDEPDADSPYDELLPGLDDDWAVRARVELDARRASRLAILADRADADGDVAQAVRWSQRLCELRPHDEAAHRSLVERLIRAGERAGAVLAAREFAERLREEVGVRPSPTTRAVHAQAHGTGGPQQRTAVFGRGTEIGWLLERWREAANGRGQVVVLSGEAGIGKSTLLAELVHRAATAGGHTATTVGSDVGGETPFAAGLDLARGLASGVRRVGAGASWPAELNRLSPGLGARLGHPQQPPPSTAPELERLRVFEALLRLVEWSCAERPTLLAIDDAHRADRASLRLAAYVGRRLVGLPALLVLGRRDGPRHPTLDDLLADLVGRGVRVSTLELAPISDGEVGALARSLHALEGADIEKVVAAAEGNPLLAVEVTRALVAGHSGPPPNLRAAVAAAMSRLAAPAVELIELVAAAGRPLDVEELQRLDVPTGPSLVSECEGLLVRRAGRLGFRHELLRAAAYAGCSDPAGLHDRLADGINPTEHVERAHHLAAAGRRAESVVALAAAGARARSVGALDEAAGLLRSAVDADPDNGPLWLELEEVYAWSHRRDDMEAAWAEALVRLPAEALPAAWCRRGRQFRSVTCHPEESLRAYRSAQQLMSADTDPATRADALIGLAWGDAVAGDGNQCEELLGAAARLTELGPQARADALEIRMQGLIRRGRFADAAALVRDGGEYDELDVTGLPDRAFGVMINAACALVCLGDDIGALDMLGRARAGTGAVPALSLKILATRAQVLARLGRHPEAASAANQVQEWADRLDDPAMAATITHDRGLVAMAAGRYAEAADLLGLALAGPADVSRVSAGLTRAEALAMVGDAVGATAQLRASLLEPVGRADQAWALVPRVAWVQALAARARGDVDETRRRLDESAAAWRRLAGAAGERAGDGYLANLVDLGRPPVIGLVEPARELARIDAIAATLAPEVVAR
jgi:DNA-binding SARP family transcriptional activator/tetratricopeptide (TPR) repeat protein